MIIREIKISDAEKLHNLMKEVEKSSAYMLWEPGERNIDTYDRLMMIKSVTASENSTILVAEKDKELVGFLLAKGGNAHRNRHSTYLVIGISKVFRGQGIGTQLINELEQWAEKSKISRLELTVVTKNTAGLSLYKKVGFVIEGTKRNSLFINGEFVDEYYMAKLL